ncbi:MAG: helix-turn-helix domain-containing protein [Nanoarchaeota archaeon]|nr:helix-turn-helix domain-containing protein [Nanoarchaeota archaeon]
MVFEKISIVKGRKYKSLVRGYRDKKGKVRHQVIKYIGAVEPVNKRRNPNAGRKPRLKVKELTKKGRDFIQKNLKNSKSFIKDRARIIHLSSEGNTVKQTCQKLGFHRPKIEKIIKQFNGGKLKIFERGKSLGKPRRITNEERAQILQYLNTEPEKLGLHFNNWRHKKLSDYAKKQGIEVSPSQLGRIIKQDEIKYKKKTSWLYSNDPNFAKKNLL